MDAPHDGFYTEPRTEPLADIRSLMDRRGDFDPDPANYARESSVFEALAALEALTIEDEVLA